MRLFLWGYLKQKLKKKRVQSFPGLKKAIKVKVQNTSQEYINKALKA